MIIVIGLLYYLADTHMFTYGLQVGKDLSVLTVGDGLLTGYYQGQGEGIYIGSSILASNDALPNPKGLKHLELL